MTETAPHTDPIAASDPRDELRAKIEARERRIAERTLADNAREAANAATDYARQNPLQVIGGAIAVGLLIGLMTRPGRRAATSLGSKSAGAVGSAASGAVKSVGGTVGDTVGNTIGRAAKKRGSAIGARLADAAVAYGVRLIDEALENARKGQDSLEEFGDAASARAREARREAEHVAASALDTTRAVSERTRRSARQAVRKLADRVTG